MCGPDGRTERDGDGQQGKWMLAWPFMSATHSNDEDNGNVKSSCVVPCADSITRTYILLRLV